ncbi:hypothetical protein [Kitasatospora sp. NBC_01266]|uniref:hypothetical protein n=1 Tax=Kitasatospora sp. NBC_01266 TaxID=2903572 RepID=UPI002E309AD8|nr:hypothetical protein [Kitasatospora sp. NBC_01266]
MELIWESGRDFIMARYIASHQQLLFRSDKGMGGRTRLEVAFGPVQYLSLHTLVYENFSIFELSPEELELCSPRPATVASSCKIYGIGSPKPTGLVIAPGYASLEDDGNYWEPSNLLRFDS